MWKSVWFATWDPKVKNWKWEGGGLWLCFVLPLLVWTALIIQEEGLTSCRNPPLWTRPQTMWVMACPMATSLMMSLSATPIHPVLSPSDKLCPLPPEGERREGEKTESESVTKWAKDKTVAKWFKRVKTLDVFFNTFQHQQAIKLMWCTYLHYVYSVSRLLSMKTQSALI